MENKKMIETIEKKLEVTVEKVLEVKQEEKDIVVDVKVGKDDYRKVVLREMKNQYGQYYKIVSESKYAGVKKSEKKETGALKIKTEKLCGARRIDIINYAKTAIGRLADGTATFKEIEGATKDNSVIRFVLILGDGTRVKEDLEVNSIRAAVCQ